MVRICLVLALAACACTSLHATEDPNVTKEAYDKSVNIPQLLTDIVWNQLHNDQTDYVNGFIALAFGYVCVYSAETIYKYFFVIAAFFCAHIVASNQIAEPDINLKTFEVMEVSVLAAYVAYKSTRGLNILLGSSVGSGVAQFLEDCWFKDRDQSEALLPAVWIVSWYAACVFVFVRLFESSTM